MHIDSAFADFKLLPEHRETTSQAVGFIDDPLRDEFLMAVADRPRPIRSLLHDRS
jgi:hypothetical protein